MPALRGHGRIAAVGLATWLVAGRAVAQEQAAPAESLFEDGRALLAEKKYPEACAKLAESEKLDPAVGTLLNLGDCYEKMGKIATAWAVFKDAASMAHGAKQAGREKLATMRAQALEGKIPRLTIRVEHAASGLDIRRDGVVLGPAEWAGAHASTVTIDPGDHDVVAVAPGRKPWSARVTLLPDGATTTVDVPELEVDELAERAPPKPADVPSVSIEAVNTHDRNIQRALGASIGAVGLATFVVSVPFGAIAISQNDAAKQNCPTNTTCTSTGANDASAAVRDGLISTVLIGVGVGVTIGGVIVFATAPAAKPKSSRAGSRLSLTPQIGLTNGGLSLQGSF